MRFWDSSAIVPLLLEQPSTARCRALLDEDPDIVAWWGTSVECASAVARVRREGHLRAADEAAALRILERLRQGWYEVLPGESVRGLALRTLRLHSLRSADALQLAAALEWSGTPANGVVVTFDDRLARSAELEGFQLA
ncbi:MAG: type II toxin-antitoxin system VapC family toxin [Gemmatimonadota bacterium]|nr:type II toxin-antitoxin system VapC family toxin [Gemmatimonadota bacterium]